MIETVRVVGMVTYSILTSAARECSPLSHWQAGSPEGAPSCGGAKEAAWTDKDSLYNTVWLPI